MNKNGVVRLRLAPGEFPEHPGCHGICLTLSNSPFYS
jgi:hypothetical protein